MSHRGKNFLIFTLVLFGMAGVMVLQRYHQNRFTENLADDSVVGKGRPVLLELGSDQCIPCREMAPILAEFDKNYASVFTVAFVDVWVVKGVAEKYGIENIPTQIFFDKDGKELFRHTGFYSKDKILEKWKQLGVEIP